MMKSRNNKNSIIFSSIKDEEIAFNKLLYLKQSNGNNTEDYLIEESNGKKKLKIYSWITGEKEYKISIGKSNNFLGKYGYNLQLYYDIIVLNLTNIYQRPRCIICGKPIEFKRFNRGYSKTCSIKCLNALKHSESQENLNCDNEIFQKFFLLNPNKGYKYSDYYYEDNYNLDKRGKSMRYYKLYKWISGKDKDEYIQSNRFPKVLKEYGMSSQVYYDIIILGLSNVKDRPKCKICGNSVKFRGLYAGYKTVCSEKCFKLLSRDTIISSRPKNLKLSEEAKDKIRVKALGRKHSEESRRKMSISRKGKKKKFSKEFIDRLIKSNKSRVWTKESREKISIASTNRLLNENIGKSNQFKRGWYYSKIFGSNIHYDSSWEERFIKMCEKLYKSGDILSFSRCTDIIIYEKEDNTVHRYLPDFKLILSNNIEVVVELKPATLVKNDRVVLLKKLAALKYYKKRGIKYIILTENELFKNIHGSFNIFDFIV